MGPGSATSPGHGQGAGGGGRASDLPRGGGRHRPEADGGRPGRSRLGDRRRRAAHGAAAGRRLPGPRAAGAGPEHGDRPAGRHPHHAARHQHRRRRVHDRRLLRRRAVRIEHRPGQRRDRLGRLRHLRHRPGRSAARPPGHPVRCELARGRLQVRAEPAQHREVRGAPHGQRRSPGQRRPRLLADRTRERAARRQGRLPGQRVLPLRRRVHRLDRQQPRRQPREPGCERHRRHARRRGPELPRPLRRAFRAAVQAVRQVHGEPGGAAAERGQRRRPARSMPTRTPSSR